MSDLTQQLKEAEWRGYATRALEDITEEVTDFKKDSERDLEEIKQQIKDICGKLNKLELRVVALGGGAGVVITVIAELAKHFINS